MGMCIHTAGMNHRRARGNEDRSTVHCNYNHCIMYKSQRFHLGTFASLAKG